MTVRIVAAALKRGTLVFSAPPPARHYTLMHEVERLFGGNHVPFQPAEQGFLGSDGRFYRRPRAKELARSAGQLLPDAATSVDLFSEDMWR